MAKNQGPRLGFHGFATKRIFWVLGFLGLCDIQILMTWVSWVSRDIQILGS